MPIDSGGGGDSGGGLPGIGGGSSGGSSTLAAPAAGSISSVTPGDSSARTAKLRSLIRSRYLGNPASGSSAALQTAVGAPPAPPAPAAPAAPAIPPAVTPAAGPVLSGEGPGTYGGSAGKANFGSGFLGSISELLRQFLGSGAFNPGVDPALLAFVKGNALQTADAERAHNALMAENLSADPATAASSALQTDLNSQGSVAKAINDAVYGEATHQRDFGQSLLEQLLGKQGPQNVYNPTSGTDWVHALASIIGAGATLGKGGGKAAAPAGPSG